MEINANGGDIAAGGVALAGDTPKFDNVKVGYDNLPTMILTMVAMTW